MTDYEQLVKALRCCTSSSPDDCDICAYQPFCQRNGTGRERIMIDATAAIEALQAQLPKRGEWIKDEEQSQKHVEAIYICSACHNFDAWGVTELYPYCPNCGAKMEVQDADK